VSEIDNRDFGRLEARVDNLERRLKSQDEKLDRLIVSIGRVENELSEAKGMSRVFIGATALVGGMVTMFGERVISKWLG